MGYETEFSIYPGLNSCSQILMYIIICNLTKFCLQNFLKVVPETLEPSLQLAAAVLAEARETSNRMCWKFIFINELMSSWLFFFGKPISLSCRLGCRCQRLQQQSTSSDPDTSRSLLRYGMTNITFFSPYNFSMYGFYAERGRNKDQLTRNSHYLMWGRPNFNCLKNRLKKNLIGKLRLNLLRNLVSMR